MLKLIVGVKGTGKTKTLINLVNDALAATKGDVVCIEKGVKLRFDIKPTARLINVNEYMVEDAQSLYGFVAGILASNHDVTDLFVDNTLKICKGDVSSLEILVAELDKLVEKVGLNMTMTVSMPESDVSDLLRKFM